MRGLTCKLPNRGYNKRGSRPHTIRTKGFSHKSETNKNIVFQAKDSKIITTEQEIEDLMKELIDNHTLG